MTSEDAISRKDIQDYIAKYLSQFLYDDVRSAVETIDAYIGDMPSIQPEKSAWRRVWNDLDGCTDFICRGCNNKNAHPTNYCPTCGRDMRGEHEIYYISWR